MLFDGLITQSEITYLLNEIYGDLEGGALDEAEGAGLTLYEERESERIPTIPFCSPLKLGFASPLITEATEM